MKMNIDWQRKLTSRKLWISVAELVAGLILAFNGGENVAQTVSGVIMSLASVIGYTIGEGLVDAKAVSAQNQTSTDNNEEVMK